MDQQLPRKQGRRQCKAVTSSPPSTAVPSMPPCQDPGLCPNRAPSEVGDQLGIALSVGGISLAVPIAQHAPILTQKQIKTPDSTGLCVSPLCKPAGTPLSPAATFADAAGALCILRARGILFWLETPVNPVPHPHWVPAPECLRALLMEMNEQF